MFVCNRISDRTRPCETVYTTSHEVHSTSRLNQFNKIAIRPIRFHTIAIRPIGFKYELYMVICYFYTFSVESSKICEAKPSKRVYFISKHTRMCDNSSITRTKVGGTLCKPCKCPVNRVKVVFNRTRPLQTVLDRTRPYLELYNIRMKIILQIVFKP